MFNLELNLNLFKSLGSKEFILGLTKDSSYRQSLLDSLQIVLIEDWEPYELKINEKSRFIVACEYDYSDPEDEFIEFPEYIGSRLHLHEFSYNEACRFLGEFKLRGYPSSVIGFSSLQNDDCLASLLRVDNGGGWDE